MTHTRSIRALMLLLALVGACALMISMMPFAPANAESEPESAVALQGDTDRIAQSDVSLLESDEPAHVVVDAKTGDIVSVTPTTADDSLSTMGMAYGCKTGQTCWYGWKALYTNYSFSGTGAAGNWPYRGTFASGNKTAAACYVSGGNKICHPRVGPNKQVTFGSSAVTGREVMIF